MRRFGPVATASSVVLGVFVCCSIALSGQGPRAVDTAKLVNPGTDSWPSYNGDYSGRRFSTLTKSTCQRRRSDPGLGLPA